MFKKNKCRKCGEALKNKFEFCPSCGTQINKSDDDWGMLGKKDIEIPMEDFSKGIFGGAGAKMMNKMLGNAMKMLEKELQKNANEVHTPRTRFELFINGKRISPSNIKVEKKQNKKKINPPMFTKESMNKFSSLPKKEPETNVRRLSNKIVYEMDIPGVESVNNISIIQLESSIEIKAISKDKAYSKVIPMRLPINRYKLEDGKLAIELQN